MNDFLGFKQWQKLFDEDVSKAYNEEKIPALRTLSMMIFSINREINKIQSDLCKEVSLLRSHFEENGTREAEDYGYLILSEEQNENIPNTSGSPEIKKKHRHDFKMKLKKKRKLCSRALLKDLNDVASNINKNRVVFNTSNSDLDASIVQATPETKTVVETTPMNFIKRRKHKDKNATLTQMFFKISNPNSDNEASARDNDSDETIASLNNSDKKSPSEGCSLMDITKMVSYLNSGLNSKSNDSDFVENDVSLNSAMIETDHNTSKEQDSPPTDLNGFLEKAQNIPPKLEAEPVVRGKARKKLPGWACKDCEKFYVNQGLDADEIMALNKCSKHRGYFRPREDTLPGFWNMDISTQESQNT